MKRIDVFISRKGADAKLAKEIYDYLTEQGLSVFDSDHTLKEIGNADYVKGIDEALINSTHMIVLGSSSINIRSSWVEAEWLFFLNRKRSGKTKGNLITVITDDLNIEDVPPSLANYEVIFFHKKNFPIIFNYVRQTNTNAKPVPKVPFQFESSQKYNTSFKIIVGLIMFGIFPGVLLTSFINYFMYLHIGQLWGFSILFCVGIFFIINFFTLNKKIALEKYVVLSTFLTCILVLFSLFVEYNFSVRTSLRLFNSQSLIPIYNLSAPSEISTILEGEYLGKAHNITYNRYGDVSLLITRYNESNDSIWAKITWTGKLIGEEYLKGTLKGINLNMYSRYEDGADDNDYIVTLKGLLEEGKVNCSYEFIRQDSGDNPKIQVGKFKALHLIIDK